MQDAFLLNIPQPPRYNKTNGAFSICAPVVWNALPYGIRSSNCINKFNVALKIIISELLSKTLMKHLMILNSYFSNMIN